MKHCTLPTLLAVKTCRAEQPCQPKTGKTLRLVKCVFGVYVPQLRYPAIVGFP